MAPTTRRPHTKSRHGCQQCKRKRTKCDETRPSCSRCLRTGAKCSLLDPSTALIIIKGAVPSAKPNTTPQQPSPPQTTPSASPPIPSPPVSEESVGSTDGTVELPHLQYAPQPSSAELERLRLMNHYSQFTSKTISHLTDGTIDDSSMWQVDIPNLAFQHEFLLHGLLSISALHIAITNPELHREYGAMAAQHHNLGITLYTSKLQNPTRDNIDALFAFGCLTGLYALGIHLKGNLKLTPLVQIHEVFTLLRGSGVIVKGCYDWLQMGIWKPWFESVKRAPTGTITHDIDTALDKLKSRIGSTISTSSQSEMYTATIEALRSNFIEANNLPRTHKSLVLLPIKAPPEFTQMVCIGEPLALAILANWAVILYWLRDSVWVSKWGHQTVMAVQEVLPAEWQDCIEWAVKEVGRPERALVGSD